MLGGKPLNYLPMRWSLAPKAWTRALCLSIACLGTTVSTVHANSEQEAFYPRAQDLLYGEALYEYHQGHFFEALTRLKVAQSRDGIQGHGDHPLLVEGGLMLAYGMTRSAKAHFEQVLSDTSLERVPETVRNQAWFYLGKVFYLEGDYQASRTALEKLNRVQLAKEKPDLEHEAAYLLAQLALDSELKQPHSTHASAGTGSSLNIPVPKTLWAVYAAYNRAVSQTRSGALAQTTHALEVLLSQLSEMSIPFAERAEAEALEDRIRLSLGQFYLQAQGFDKALAQLRKVRLDSAFSDEALFQYAVVNSHLGQFEQALGALKTLDARPKFTPWLQQVPYATAFLYERMGDPALALQAFTVASEHYDQQLNEIADQITHLDESTLLAAIAPLDDGPSVPSASDQANPEGLRLGDVQTLSDAYGRLPVEPAKFELAQLLSQEAFQLALRDLHELYKLQTLLKQRSSQFDTFELMLETRAQQRNEKLVGVIQELSEQNVGEWQATTQAYEKAINAALASGDARFFMNEEQMEYVDILDSIEATLAVLPEEDREEFELKFKRAKGVFEYWLADTYGVNRWAAQKQMKALKQVMEEYQGRDQYLNRELANTEFQSDLIARVEQAKGELATLQSDIERSLEVVRNDLMALVIEELEQQTLEVKRYRLASRHAQARLSDQLYQVAEPDAKTEPEANAAEQGGEL